MKLHEKWISQVSASVHLHEDRMMCHVVSPLSEHNGGRVSHDSSSERWTPMLPTKDHGAIFLVLFLLLQPILASPSTLAPLLHRSSRRIVVEALLVLT